MDTLHFCPFMVKNKKGPTSTGKMILTLCRAVYCIWLFPLCSCMLLRTNSDFSEGLKRTQNKMTATFRLFMFNPHCCLYIMWGVTVVKGERGKELFLSCDPTKCLKHSLLLTFYVKAGSLNRVANTALLSCCPALNLHWQSFVRDSQETFKTFVGRAYLPQKKFFSCSEKCVQTIRSPQNVSHPSQCRQHCQESNSSLEYLSISFWLCFGGPLPSSISEQVLCLVINLPKKS